MKGNNPFDHWKSMVVSLYMTLVGYGVLVGVPVISTAWVQLLGFTDAQVGRVVSFDLGGLSAGAIVTSLLVRRINRRLLAFAGLMIAVMANTGCIWVTGYHEVMILRLASGVGGGIYTAIAVVTLGSTSRPAKSYGMMMLAFAFSQAGEMHLLPQLPMHGIYLVFIVGFLLTLPWLRWLPAFPYVPGPDPPTPGIPGMEVKSDNSGSGFFPRNLFQVKLPARWLPWLCLLAVFFTYNSIGAYWTYIELSALRAGITESWIVPLLTWVSFGSILGCIVAMLVSDRFGLSRPLLVSLIMLALVVGLPGMEINRTNLLISLLFFNWLWIFIDVYQMSTAAVLDQTGRYASLLPASQGLGQIIGPNIAAGMLDSGMPYEWIFMMCAGMILLGILVYWFMYLRLRRRIPALVRSVRDL